MQARMRAIEGSEADCLANVELFMRLDNERLQYASTVMEEAARLCSQYDPSPARRDHPAPNPRQLVVPIDASGSEHTAETSFARKAQMSGASHRTQRAASMLDDFYEPNHETSLATVADEDEGSPTTRRRSSVASPVAKSTIEERMVANFDFEAATTQELSFKAGDTIKIVHEDDSGWWTGQLVDGRGRVCSEPGLFPENYCSRSTARKPAPAPPRPEHIRLADEVESVSIADTPDSPRSMRSVSSSTAGDNYRINPMSSTDSLARPNANRSITLPLDLNAARAALKQTAPKPNATPIQTALRNASQSSLAQYGHEGVAMQQQQASSPTPKQRRRPPPPPAARNASRTSVVDAEPTRRSPPRVSSYSRS